MFTLQSRRTLVSNVLKKAHNFIDEKLQDLSVYSFFVILIEECYTHTIELKASLMIFLFVGIVLIAVLVLKLRKNNDALKVLEHFLNVAIKILLLQN